VNYPKQNSGVTFDYVENTVVPYAGSVKSFSASPSDLLDLRRCGEEIKPLKSS